MSTMAFAAGTPCWFDATAPDIGAAADFYRGLFGWGAEDMGPEAGHYTVLTQEGAQVAGIASATDPEGGVKPAAWLPYFAVESAAAATAVAQDSGAGVFVEPTDVFGTLEFALLTDPDGAPYGVCQLKSHPGTERWGEVGNPCWVQYAAVRAPAEAMAHYAKVLGWTYRNAGWETATVNPYQALSVSGGREFGGAALAAPGAPGPFWSMTIRVSDTEEIAARAEKLGGSVLQAPQDMPGPSSVGVLNDPFGAAFAIMSFGN
ncbi:VOC family protein [Nocardia sp. NPDC050406]|uniref:VOC family protein n=1 Tax=Nocardia sp. NPDC050406 TaxID=3364318 RepID=UPI003797D95F